MSSPDANSPAQSSAESPAAANPGGGKRPKIPWYVHALIAAVLGVPCFICLMPGGHPPESYHRTASKQNHKQFGLAFHGYHDAHATFPPGGTYIGDVGHHGWITHLLPWLDQEPLFNQINFSVPYDHPRNVVLFKTPIPGLTNRSNKQLVDETWFAPTHYAANDEVLGRNRGLRIRDFTDGTSTTIVVGDIRDNFPPWGSPDNFRSFRLGINRSPEGFGSRHTGGMHVLMADGSARFISETICLETLTKLAHPTDGLEVGEY